MELLDAFRNFALDQRLAEHCFIVGGTVRDLLLGKGIKDADIAVKGDAINIGRSFANASGGTFVLLDKDFGISRVVMNHESIDICSMRGDSIADDLGGRDLTINAMALPHSAFGIKQTAGNGNKLKELLVDPFNGYRDLEDGIIRMVSEKNLADDPLRLLRIYRFAATLGFSIEAETSSAVKTLAPLIADTAPERIAEELRHILRSGSSHSVIREMENSGLLFHLFPELVELSPDVWHQIRQAYTDAELILANLPLYFSDKAGHISRYFATVYKLNCLKLSVLFEDGDRSEKIARRLKLSKKETDFINMISSNHQTLSSPDIGKKEAVIALLRKFGDDIYPILIYLLAYGHAGQSQECPLLSPAKEIVSIYQDEFLPRLKLLPVINGHDLIREYNLSPSPFFKDILSAIELLALEGRIKSREEALKAAGNMIRKKGMPE